MQNEREKVFEVAKKRSIKTTLLAIIVMELFIVGLNIVMYTIYKIDINDLIAPTIAGQLVIVLGALAVYDFSMGIDSVKETIKLVDRLLPKGELIEVILRQEAQYGALIETLKEHCNCQFFALITKEEPEKVQIMVKFPEQIVSEVLLMIEKYEFAENFEVITEQD